MDQRISFITLGVEDLESMSSFYKQQFGWTPLKEMEGICFFLLNGMVLGLFPAKELADDIGIRYTGSGFKKFSLSINYGSEAEVDAAFNELSSARVEIIKPPAKVFWGGYSGYIADPEGNYWELAFNPFALLDDKKNITGHE